MAGRISLRCLKERRALRATPNFCRRGSCVAHSARCGGASGCWVQAALSFPDFSGQLHGLATPQQDELDALLQAKWRPAHRKWCCPWLGALALTASPHRDFPPSAAGPEPSPEPTAHPHEPHDHRLPRCALASPKHHPSTRTPPRPTHHLSPGEILLAPKNHVQALWRRGQRLHRHHQRPRGAACQCQASPL